MRGQLKASRRTPRQGGAWSALTTKWPPIDKVAGSRLAPQVIAGTWVAVTTMPALPAS